MSEDLMKSWYLRWKEMIEGLSKCGGATLNKMCLQLLPGYILELRNGSRLLSPDGIVVGSEIRNIDMARQILDVVNNIYGFGFPTMNIQRFPGADPTLSGQISSGGTGGIPGLSTSIDTGISNIQINPEEVRADIKSFEDETNDKLRHLVEKYGGRLKITLNDGKILVNIIQVYKSH